MIDLFKDLMHEFQRPINNPVLIFSLILFIILLAPIFLRKFNLPGIIGLLVSGILIGPNGLNLLEKNSAIDLFSTIGLLYIMFIAGLELDMNEFKKNRNKSFLFGFFTFLIPLLIGFPICRFILGYNFYASILIASMFATHTLVSYPIVSKLGISKNQAVAITVGGTILTDTAVLIVLAVIMGNSQGVINHFFWIKLGFSLVVFSIIMFMIIPNITKWFFKKIESEKQAHYIYVMLVVFFSAFLAEIAGLEPIIGAFMAGLALNPLIPHSSVLMNRIEFIGNSLFIPFFLISVGMLIDIRVILSGPNTLIVALVLTIGATAGKWLAALFTQLIFKFSSAQRQLIFGLSSAHAAAILAVVLVGYKAGIIDINVLNGTIILILITSIISLITTEKAAKKILISENDTELQGTKIEILRNEHILLPIANILNIDNLLEFTLLIKDNKSANPVTFLSVVPNNAEAEMNIISARKKLEEFKVQGTEAAINVNTIATIDYNPASGIARISREIMADIIVLGWPKKAGVLERLIGEKINTIIRNADKSVFICSLEKQIIYQKRIIVFTLPLAEKENGFEIWLQKLIKLSSELGIPIVHFGSKNTQDIIEAKIVQHKWTKSIIYNVLVDWDKFDVITNLINDNDLLVFVSARKKAISYASSQENITNIIEKHFNNNDKIIVYPRQ